DERLVRQRAGREHSVERKGGFLPASPARSSARSDGRRDRSHIDERGYALNRTIDDRRVSVFSEDPRERSRASARESARTRETRRDSGRASNRGSRRAASRGPRVDDRIMRIVAVVGIVLLVTVVGWFAWTHRPVEVTVNGTRRTVSVNARLERLIDDPEDYSRGDYVSVSGKVLEEGEGYTFSATVDGEEIPDAELADYRVKGGEDIVFGDGNDRCEEYTATPEDIPPRLVSDGTYGAIVYVSQWGKPGVRESRIGWESGETASVVAKEPVDCVISAVNVEPADGRMLVALTFDDGPSAYTERYLDILREHGAKATFFNLGEEMEQRPELAAQIVADGHELMSHTYHHYQLTTLLQDELLNEIDSTFALTTAAGNSTTVFRAPYGDFTLNTWLLSGGHVSVSVLWNIDTLDWEQPGAEAIIASATSVSSGDIILMHDGGGPREDDLAALPVIIDTLHEQGYEFVTITELMQSDPRIPEEIASGQATVPSDAVWPTEVG
ncbi:MAG: polysaccharide deacetylase family protein, partial [Atopobiaceae bacterium]|nr:polysaccharide deacetylase family protein [Atopobiaceae bacterium]